MTWLTLGQVAAMAGGSLHPADAAAVGIARVERDSRQVQPGDLFLALKGERFDAHDFVPQVVGVASAALVARPLEVALPQVVVDDVRLALGRLAAAWRQQFTVPLIGLTGSNGKTTVKEMLTAILSCVGNTLATVGNLNNDIGVPLTLLNLRAAHRYAVVEMGMNHFGEIAYLTRLARPDVAIITNAGAAHLEGVGDLAGVARAKGEIFEGLAADGVAVLNADDAFIDYWRGLNVGRRMITFGMAQPADVAGAAHGQVLTINWQGESVPVRLALLGRHNQMNALAAAAAALAVGVPLSAVQRGLESMQPVKGRMQPKAGLHGGLVIDDTYNANPSSTAAAVQVLAGMGGRRVLVLGDMGELGADAVALHAGIGQQAAALGIDALYSLGTLSGHASAAFGVPQHAYQDLAALLDALRADLTEGVTVLVKGSRASRMERVVDALTLAQEGN